MEKERLELLEKKALESDDKDLLWLIEQAKFAQRLEKYNCPNCADWEDYRVRHCHICDGTKVIFVKYNE